MSPPIGEALAFDALDGLLGAHGVGKAEAGAVAVPEIELGQVAL
jgi:hypothetical protein